MTSSAKLLFFAGSAREGSYNKRLARLGAEIAEANGIPSTFADLGDYPMPLYDADLQAIEGIPDNARKLEALMKIHSGVLIACPEYNASITPLLKNTLDWISRIKNEGEEPLAVFKTRVFALGIRLQRRHGRFARPEYGAHGPWSLALAPLSFPTSSPCPGWPTPGTSMGI